MSRATRFDYLDRARDAVARREAAYGPPAPHFERTAALWSFVFGRPVAPHEVALALALLKIGRVLSDPHHEDSWVDLIGYAAIGAERADARFHEITGGGAAVDRIADLPVGDGAGTVPASHTTHGVSSLNSTGDGATDGPRAGGPITHRVEDLGTRIAGAPSPALVPGETVTEAIARIASRGRP